MRLPIRNKSERALTIFFEPVCHDYEIPPGGEAIVFLEDGALDSIDVFEGQVSIWDNAAEARVEIVSDQHNEVVDTLSDVRGWLWSMGGRNEAAAIEAAIERLEPTHGYLKARLSIFAAFHEGFRIKGAEASPRGGALPAWPGSAELEACYRAGGTAAWLNRRARRRFGFPGWGKGPFDTEYMVSAFERAAKLVA